MKKDINFLEARKQGEGKKSANTMVLLAVVMLIVFAVLIFVFVKTQNEIADYNKKIDNIKIQIDNNKFEIQQANYNKVKKQMDSYLTEIYSKDFLQNETASIDTLSGDVLDIIYQACKSEEGITEVIVDNFVFDSNQRKIIIEGDAIDNIFNGTTFDQSMTNVKDRLENSTIDIGEQIFDVVSFCEVTGNIEDISKRYDESGQEVNCIRIVISIELNGELNRDMADKGAQE